MGGGEIVGGVGPLCGADVVRKDVGLIEVDCWLILPLGKVEAGGEGGECPLQGADVVGWPMG